MVQAALLIKNRTKQNKTATALNRQDLELFFICTKVFVYLTASQFDTKLKKIACKNMYDFGG